MVMRPQSFLRCAVEVAQVHFWAVFGVVALSQVLEVLEQLVVTLQPVERTADDEWRLELVERLEMVAA